MLNLFIVLKGLLSPKIVLPELFGLFYFKTKEGINKLPDRVDRDSLSGYSHAFSLVEMLMALLVASLLLAALAPVMTRRMSDSEIKVMSEAANYDKDMVVSVFTEDADFNIPTDANQVRVTMMGGGGAGGNALYGKREFTSTQNFTVPKDVTKLRVFMIGGGGGGASGGHEINYEYADIPALNNAETDILTVGNYTFASAVTPPSSYMVPVLDNKCTASNISSKWTIVSNNTTVDAGRAFSKFSNDINVTLNKVTACGGGGASGPGGVVRGGSGGYIKDVVLNKTAAASSISLGVGGNGAVGQELGTCVANNTVIESAGGAGGVGWNGLSGQNGVRGYVVVAADPCAESGGGGGGGGATGGGSGGTVYFMAPGGGGAGGSHHAYRTAVAIWGEGGKGGDGGGTNAGLGGGGIWRAGTDWRAGSGATGYVAGLTGANTEAQYVRGGGGGGGIGGVGGGYGELSTIFGSGRCNADKPGAIHLWYSTPFIQNGLKCPYYRKSNGGGGGAAGQISIGEITVTPGEVLTFEIGAGGLTQNASGQNGNSGKATYIKRGTSALMSANGGYGGEYSSSESTPSQGGSFRNPVVGVNWMEVDYKNNNSYAAGSNGNLATGASNAGYGGSGGYSQDIRGNLIAGGTGGNTSKNGLSPAANNYGAGGGGGAGSQAAGDTTFGTGAAGASGYIYVEWGGSNGGGGTIGEFVQKIYTNIDNNNRVMKIRIGRGGGTTASGSVTDASTIGANGNGGITSTKVYSGGKEITYSVNGGIKGKDGNVNRGVHGDATSYPSGYADKYKEYVQGNMNIIAGHEGSDEYGGMGGYLACIYISRDEDGNKACAASVKANDGTGVSIGPSRPGCGGTSAASPLYEAICKAYSTSDSPNGGDGALGGGGGGGAVLDNVAGQGGKGGDGFVILEYKSTRLD